LRKQNASQSENAAEDHTSPKQYPSRRSLPNDADMVQDKVHDKYWTEDDRQGEHKEIITTPLPQQNSSASERAAEGDTSLVHRRGRRSLPKAPDMQPRDNHWVEGDKAILSNSHSRSDDGVVAGIEPHDSLTSGHDSRSPATAMAVANDDDVAAAAVADTSRASMDGEQVHVSMMACYHAVYL